MVLCDKYVIVICSSCSIILCSMIMWNLVLNVAGVATCDVCILPRGLLGSAGMLKPVDWLAAHSILDTSSSSSSSNNSNRNSALTDSYYTRVVNAMLWTWRLMALNHVPKTGEFVSIRNEIINIWFSIRRLNKYILYGNGFLKARRPPKV